MFLQACAGSKGLTLPAELSANNRSSDIIGSAQYLPNVRLLDYRGYKDSVISNREVDKFANLGLIFPHTRTTKNILTGELLFGNDSLKCVIHYTYYIETHISNGQSVLGAVLEKGNHDYSKDVENVYRYATGKGTITIPGFADSASYFFGRDSSNTLIINKDSFAVKYVKERESGSIYIIDGFQLLKGEIVYAVMQNHSSAKLTKPRIYLYSKATALEQMVIAAYLAIRQW
ncbi:MAG TPA: hypothetical protein PKJ94_08525 [Ferruginibacter sp.]|nr:hypothetical protein [Ferruginibacter sp.]